MQCPYCGQQHPAGAEFCPETGFVLSPAPNRSKAIYLGLGLVSVLLVTFSLIMLRGEVPFINRLFTDPNSPIGQPAPQAGPSGDQPETNNLQVLPPVSATSTSQPTATATPLPTSTLTETPVPIPSPVELRTNPLDEAEIVLVPGGEFIMGSDPADDPYFWGAEAPSHTVAINSFWIYRTEVTQRMYQVCDEQNACPAPVLINDPIAKQYGNPRFSEYPVVMITWQSALAYCQWAGGRLPTEAEWEKAARGEDGWLFPWGNDPDAKNRANFSSPGPEAVGSYPLGSSPYGVYDLAGNVLEWVNDFFESGYYQYSPLENPLGPLSGERKIIRGGAFNHSTVDGLRTVARASLRSADTRVSVGFRCVIDEP